MHVSKMQRVDMVRIASRIWTPAQIEQLKALVDSGASAASSATALKRSIVVVQTKARHLGKRFLVIEPRRNSDVRTLYLNGEGGVEAVAEMLGERRQADARRSMIAPTAGSDGGAVSSQTEQLSERAHMLRMRRHGG
jgi:hypothetical protein